MLVRKKEYKKVWNSSCKPFQKILYTHCEFWRASFLHPTLRVLRAFEPLTALKGPSRLRSFMAPKALEAPLRATRALRALRALDAIRALRVSKGFRALRVSKIFKTSKIVGVPPIASPRPSQKLALRPKVLTTSREQIGNGQEG